MNLETPAPSYTSKLTLQAVGTTLNRYKFCENENNGLFHVLSFIDEINTTLWPCWGPFSYLQLFIIITIKVLHGSQKAS